MELEELQTATEVRFCVVPSVYIPVAMNCCFVPLAMLVLTGVIEMEPSVAGETVRFVEPDRPPAEAVIVVVPVARAAASPELLMVAIAVLVDVQVDVAVRSWVVLSENDPVAMNC